MQRQQFTLRSFRDALRSLRLFFAAALCACALDGGERSRTGPTAFFRLVPDAARRRAEGGSKLEKPAGEKQSTWEDTS